MRLNIHIDGGARGNPGTAGAGVLIEDERGRTLLEAGYFLGHMTNNMAEYNALLRALVDAEKLGATVLHIFSDSELLVRQINGDYRVKNQKLVPLFKQASTRLRSLKDWRVHHIPREQNHRADALANEAMDAGDDVILHRVKEAAAGQPPAADKSDDPDLAIILVRCTKAPDETSCPSPCAPEATYAFGATVPQGVCVEAACVLAPAVLAMRESRSPSEVSCPRSGCGARFSISVR